MFWEGQGTVGVAWIEFHTAKIKRLQKFRDFRQDLGWSVNEALGFLGNFWGEIIELKEDGDISGWKADYIVELTNVKIAPDNLWESLVKNRWIDVKDGKVLIHDWLDVAGKMLTNRYASDYREKLMDIWAMHGKTYGRTLPSVSQVVPNTTLPNPTRPNQTKPNQEETTPPDKPDGASPVKILIDDFYKKLERKIQEKPVGFNGGLAGRGFKEILKKSSPEEIQIRMDCWFASDDQFIAKRGWKIQDFFQNYNNLKNGPMTGGKSANGNAGFAAPIPGKYDNLR